MGQNIDRTPLLEAADQNIGNSAVLRPQAGAAGTVIPNLYRERLLELTGGSSRGQTVSVVFTLSRIVRGGDNPNPGFAGPVTGIIEYGNGGRDTAVEFDLVTGPFAGSVNEASSAILPRDGIVTVTVPTGMLRVYARYDNLLLAPVLGTNPPMSLAQLNGIPANFTFGPGGPLVCGDPSNPPPATITIPPEPVLVKAMACWFTKPRAKVYKTLNCYLSAETVTPIAIPIGNLPASQVAGYPGYAFWALPAFTRSVTVERFPNSTAFTALLHDGVRPVEFYTVLANTPSPTFEVRGNECIIGISTGVGTVNMLKLVCEVGI